MGLDVTLGVIILVAALRGWFQGFITQTVRIAGLVACVYVAEPVRDYAKPYVLPYLPTIDPALIDRLLWWVSAVVTYVVLVGVATLVIKLTRRPEIPGMAQSGRNDQFAGFMLGAAKGLLVAAFATAGIEKYAMEPIKAFPWAREQVKTSWAAMWNEQYHPAPKIWLSVPVRHFVNHVERMGVRKPGKPSQSPAGEEANGEAPAVRTARRPSGPDVATDPHTAGARTSSPAASGSPSSAGSDSGYSAGQANADIKADLNQQPRGSN